jgi:hypothetical protein
MDVNPVSQLTLMKLLPMVLLFKELFSQEKVHPLYRIYYF